MVHAMPIGGIETALLSMLRKLDYKKYSVELLLIAAEGERLCEIPKQVKVRAVSDNDRCFLERSNYAISRIRIGKNISNCLIRIYYSIKYYFCQKMHLKYDIWKDLLKHVKFIEGEYDIAVDYDGFCNRFILKKVTARKKILWNHFDYHFFSEDLENDKKYFKYFDYLVSVSEMGAQTLKQFYPELEQKIITIYNILDEDFIRKQANEPIEEKFNNDNRFKICSVGRLEKQKDFELAIRAANCLKKMERNFVWYVIGEGAEKEHLQKLICQFKLNDEFLLLGKRENPYPYIQACDVYVQTSASEGLCVAVTEARVLYKPIVVVDIQGLRELVMNGKTGRIVRREEEEIAKAISFFYGDNCSKFSDNIKNMVRNNDDSLKRFYQLCEE